MYKRQGISIVLEEIGIENQIKNADIVITGEGRLDGQTEMCIRDRVRSAAAPAFTYTSMFGPGLQM